LSTLAIATAREVFDLLRDDLVAIEQELGRDAASSVSTITEIAEYLREGGGNQWDRTVIHGFLSLIASGQLPQRPKSKSRHERALPTASDVVLPADDFLRNAA